MVTVTHASHSTIQLAGIVLKLRDDLTFSVREYGGAFVYCIEDELKSRFYRVGLAEYTFLSLLDGRRTFADALGQTATVARQDALTESDAAALCRWLVENGLASTAESRSSLRLFEAANQIREGRAKSRWNPMFVKLPLCNPDRIMQVGAAVAGWIFSVPALLLWLLVVSVGALCVAIRWSEATSMSSHIVSPQNWFWLAATTVVLKLLHEFGHGIACRYFGGSVREAGVMTILFVPLPYVDVTSAWRLERRWQRIMVSAAGMYCELFLAAIAAVTWYNTSPGLLHQHAFAVMFSASLVTVLFNLNPLMRFDGYFILTDIFEQPNLAGHAQQRLKSLASQWILGLPATATALPEGRPTLVLLYGIAAFVWRVVVCVGLIATADAMFFGSGVVLAVIAISLWVVVPVFRLVKFIAVGSDTQQPNLRRVAMIAGMAATLLLFIANRPWHEHIQAPAIVDYDPIVEIRCGVSGFVQAVNVRAGERVLRDQVLVELRNPELQLQQTQLLSELAQSQQRGRVFHQRQEIAAWQVEVATAESISDRLRQLEKRIANLTIRSSVEGIIVENRLRNLQGTYVKSGTPVVSVGEANTVKVMALVSEENLHVFQNHVLKTIDVHIHGDGTHILPGQLEQIAPRGSTQIPHPAFSATAGGPLDVVVQQATSKGPSRAVFASPQFLTRIHVSPQQLASILPGRLGFVSLAASRGTAGEVAAESAARWWAKRQAALQQTWSSR